MLSPKIRYVIGFIMASKVCICGEFLFRMLIGQSSDSCSLCHSITGIKLHNALL